MNQLVTQAIVLTRINYGEADRILTLLTPNYGKIRVMAKGVRRVKSKLAGGIELFSVSEITFIKGKGDIGTLVSSRLKQHHAGIVADINRTMLGYDLIKQLNKATEDECEAGYFEVLQTTFESLADKGVSSQLVQLWFAAQLLQLGGHTPNLQTDAKGQKLMVGIVYSFEFDVMAFSTNQNGKFKADHIKFLRLVFAGNKPTSLVRVQGVSDLTATLLPLIENLQRQS
ncbi:MAG: DNA repair protein RecO [Candidatus Saccharimonadales bacterium]